MAELTFQYSTEDLVKAFERAGIPNVDVEDKHFAGYINSLIAFMGSRESRGLNISGTKVVVSKTDASQLRITLYGSSIYPGRFPEAVRAFQKLMKPTQ